MTRPTKKQYELLKFIDGFVKGNGYGPSYREIMRALDYRSVSTVATHVNGLIARGWLVKRDKSARSLEVVSLQNHNTPEQITQVAAGYSILDELAKKRDEIAADEARADDVAALDRVIELFTPSPDDK